MNGISRRVMLAGLASASAFGSQAVGQERRVGPATLLNALKSARGGETILLEPGRYGPLEIAGLQFADLVHLKSETPRGAVFPRIVISGCRNLRIDGVHVSNPGNGGSGARIVNIIDQSQNIHFINSEVNAKIDGTREGFYAIHGTGNLRDIIIAGNYLHDIKVGVAFFGVQNLAVQDNRIDRILGDSFKFSHIENGAIERNMGARTIFSVPGEHYDFVQFQGDSRNVVVRNNLSMPRTVPNVQGVFLNNGRYSDILVENNVIVSSQIRGVSINNSTNSVARNNTLINIPGIGAKATKAIDFSDYYNNILTSYPSDAGQDRNLTLQNTQPGKPFYYGDYFANPEAGLEMTLRDLLPRPGSLAERFGAVGTVEAFLRRYG
ncbi:MAG: right-handed parallel beta-helix repeat-containing protein [Pseudomonadota bacterium]